MGLAQQGRCSEYGYDYNIQHISLSSSSISQSLTIPILFNGPSSSCIDDEHIKNCTILHTSPILQLPSNLFEKYFSLSTSTNDPSDLVFVTMFVLAAHVIGSLFMFLFSIDDLQSEYIFAKHLYKPVFTGIFVVYFIFESTTEFHLLYIEKCDDIVILSTEALSICRSIAACGLTIVSLNNIKDTSLYGYITMSRLLAYYIGFTTALYFVFLVVCDVVGFIANRCEAHRQSIIGKRGSERDVALEAAPIWFINEYLPSTHWQYVSNPLVSNRYEKCEISLFTTNIPPTIQPESYSLSFYCILLFSTVVYLLLCTLRSHEQSVLITRIHNPQVPVAIPVPRLMTAALYANIYYTPIMWVVTVLSKSYAYTVATAIIKSAYYNQSHHHRIIRTRGRTYALIAGIQYVA